MGTHAVLLELDGLEQVWAYAAEAMRRRAAGQLGPASDIVAGARTVLFDGLADPAAFCDELASWSPDPAAASSGRLHELEIRYDGEDLEVVAEQLGMGREAFIELHCAREHRVAFLGFAPGFAYLAGLAPHRVARRSTPRTRVEAGSVGVADEYTGIYPRASPGGWQLIGRCDAWLWDLDRQSPARFAPGDRVRFVPAAA
ncbi:MAG: allophanate hydrolase subunit 1 [Actinomycetota bacterium]|nr:allophanate hydrolase subunit 1 [Actinomycetota bacterium]